MNKKTIIKIVIALFLLFGLAAGSAVLAFSFFNLDLPKLDKLQDYKPNLASQIISKDGVILAELGLEKREIATMKEIPARVVDAFLSAEDDQFFTHKGVDYWGLVRAMFANLKAGRVVQGGSTITQQVAKSFLLSSERSITRKVKDFILAQRIEEKLTKEEILFLYLNQVYLGGGYYGVKAAAHGYFGKELKDMTVAEAAMIAGLLVAPGKYSPYVNPLAAKKRQGYVLERMLKNKKITQVEYDAAIKEKTIYQINDDKLKAGYFSEWVRQKVVEQVGEESFLKNGFRVVTTLDWELQKNAEIQLLKGIKEIDRRQGYKGPIARIGLDELPRFEEETRKKIMRERSTFFTIESGVKNYEFHFDVDGYKKIKESMANIKSQAPDDFLVPGIEQTDKFIDVLESNKSYEAVVLKVDDISRIVYVSLGGMTGIISHEYFKWAHKRSINENTAYYKEIDKPSDILRMGDIIHVEVVKKNISIQPYLSKDGSNFLSKSKSASLVKNQKYLLLQLDQVPEVQGALYAIDSHTGEVLSYVGGTDYSRSKFNRVIQAKRQPGSSFKPLLFAAALERGYTANSIIMDTPEAMPGFDSASSWKPKNYDGEFLGPVTFRQSLEQSRNIPTIKIADRVGVSNILNFANRIGFNATLENNLSIALGTFGVNLRDLTSTFAIFPNGGNYIIPKAIVSITDREGKKFFINEFEKDMKKPVEIGADTPRNGFQANLSGNQVYDPRLAYIMTHIMKGVVTSGTAGFARDLSPNIAGKTGTTNDYVDAWFIGFNAKVVTSVWAGFDDNKTLGYGETGGKSVLPVWKEYMRGAMKKYGDPEHAVPAGISFQWVDKKTGLKVSANSPNSVYEAFTNDENLALPVDPTGTAEVAPKPANKGDDDYYNNQ